MSRDFQKVYSQKYAPFEHDGLQVAVSSAPQSVGYDQPGLIVYNPPGKYDNDKYIVRDVGANPTAALSTAAKRKRRKRWILVAAVVGILVIAAAVVAAVLLTRRKADEAVPATATSPASASASASAPSVPTATPAVLVTRARSTEGTWNGTGLATAYAQRPGFWSFLFYQDYTGAIQAAEHTKADNLTIGIKATFPVNIKAANGTALAAAWYNKDQTVYYHLIYVNRDNILSDTWLDERMLDPQDIPLSSTPWTPGNLDTLNFKVPTDNRVGMFLKVDDVWYGKDFFTGGAKLVVGGSDGLLHQVSYDWASRSWSPDIFKFDNSWAYGGVQIRAPTSVFEGFNTTVYSTAKDGSLQYRVQMQNPNNETVFPSGGVWQEPVTTNVQAAQNSSQSVSWDGGAILFPNQQGRLGRESFDLAAAGKSQFGTYSNQLEGASIMTGTDMTWDSLDGKILSFYQSNGSNIAYRVYDVPVTGLLTSGVVLG